jgi:hypothetical protein
VRKRAGYFAQYNGANGRRASKRPRASGIVAIDGEGYTAPDGTHRYCYMAASDEEGLIGELENAKGLTAEEVFGWLCKLPRGALLVGFSLGYDRTKWLESWPDEGVYQLLRPEIRQGDKGALPVAVGGFRANLLATRFTIRRADEPRSRRTVWDVFKFFQCSFVKALARWDIGTPDERARIERDKSRRKDFESIGERERTYCQLETRLLALLVRKLLTAHREAGLFLQSYFGPGSTAAIVLKEHGEQRAVIPPRMALAVLTAYFGGRFELSRMGPVEADELFAYDITSAYPAAMAELPCFRHGRWVHDPTGARWRDVHVALVRFRLHAHKGAPTAWGVLPHRMPDGNILFPSSGAGGWAWSPEVRAASDVHPGVHVLEAWLWEQACDCDPPFEKRIHELFRKRLEWGKEAAGIVLKLALNSLYGKSAQRAGKARYRCMVRAGLITSMTRAKLVRAASMAKGWDSILELATDSVLSREPLLGIEAPGLGGWSRKPWPGGAFLMRPGLRFALEPGEASDMSRTAARGVGTRVLHANRAAILGAWRRAPFEPVTVATPSFFHGAKLEVRRVRGAYDADELTWEYRRGELYGRWTDETRTLTYAPKPKRESIRPDGSLALWELPMSEACQSVPYGMAEQSLLGDELERGRERDEDQPDGEGLSLV